MLHEYYGNWLKSTNERQKLQTIYLSIAVVAVVVAGLFSLVNPELGQTILKIAYLAGFVWIVNFVTWALFFTAAQNKTQNTPSAPRLPRKK